VSVKNFIPELWSRLLLTNFRKNHVFASLVNRNYEGEIRNQGDTVKITTPSAITVGPYTGTVTYEVPASTQQNLLIDQAKYWAFAIDDIDEAQANVNTMAAYMEEAAQSLADEVDKNLAALYTDAGLTQISLDVGTDDFYDKLTVANQQLSEANVPKDGRWVVITPKGHSNLLQNDAFIHATQKGDAVIADGRIGRAAGFNVYESNNLVNTTASSFAYMYGTNRAITLAEQVVKTEAIRREASFSDGARGLLVFGRKVVRPASLGVILADET